MTEICSIAQILSKNLVEGVGGSNAFIEVEYDEDMHGYMFRFSADGWSELVKLIGMTTVLLQLMEKECLENLSHTQT